MGAKATTLSVVDLENLSTESGLSEDAIARLHIRFQQLDRR
jgi:hypothetical protein